MLDFIVNVKSGKGNGLKVMRAISEVCFKSNIAYSVHVPDAPKKAEQITKKLCEQGAQTIVAVGGDGTFHEVINGVKDYPDTKVGFICAGRGNDFARVANINKNPVKALEDILRGEIRHVDVLSVDGVRCLNTAGTGLDVEVLKRVAGEGGKITYLLSLIRTLKNFHPYKVTVHTPEGARKHECITVGVCNGVYFGGGMKFSPLSKIDDGEMNVVIVDIPEDGKIMKALGGFLKGKHINKSYVRHFNAQSVLIETDDNLDLQLDGEIYEGLKFDCQTLKGALKTFVTK